MGQKLSFLNFNNANKPAEETPKPNANSPLLIYKFAERIAAFIDESRDIKTLQNLAVAMESRAEPVKLRLYEIKHRKFLQYIVYGQQDEAENMLKTCEDKGLDAQFILSAKQKVTDYSKRTFECSAYEYAYWAKDIHMLRMLEKYMDKDTKAIMLKRCKLIELHGLRYEQLGIEVQGSKHFDLTNLITALENYVNGYDNRDGEGDDMANLLAWRNIGLKQRELPAHVINEYCQKNRSIGSSSNLDEDTSFRTFSYFNILTGRNESVFPLKKDERLNCIGIGVIFTLYRGNSEGAKASPTVSPKYGPSLDLDNLKRLDKLRNTELKKSLINLGWVETELAHSSWPEGTL